MCCMPAGRRVQLVISGLQRAPECYKITLQFTFTGWTAQKFLLARRKPESKNFGTRNTWENRKHLLYIQKHFFVFLVQYSQFFRPWTTEHSVIMRTVLSDKISHLQQSNNDRYKRQTDCTKRQPISGTLTELCVLTSHTYKSEGQTEPNTVSPNCSYAVAWT